MKVVERVSYPGWDDYPVYHCKEGFDYYISVGLWCAENNVETFLIWVSTDGYTFQVKSNHEWFVLRWS
jgi:hypothetical protein